MSLVPNYNLRHRSDFPGDDCARYIAEIESLRARLKEKDETLQELQTKLAEAEKCLRFAQTKLLESAAPYDAAAMRISETLAAIAKGEK